MEMMLDKKQIQATFLFEFKMGHKAAEATCNINKAFGPGTANECTVQCWFKFCKEMRALKMRNIMAGLLEVDNKFRGSRSWSSYSYTRGCWRTQCQSFYGYLAFEVNWKGEKVQ